MYNEEILKIKLARIEENVAIYFNEFKAWGWEDAFVSQYVAEEIKRNLAELTARRETYESYLWELKDTGETQKLTTDPEARMMLTKDDFACCYNVQTAVDRGNHLIAEFEVTSDYNSLKKVAQQAKETLDMETIHASADKGYNDHEKIEECVLNGIIPHRRLSERQGGTSDRA